MWLMWHSVKALLLQQTSIRLNLSSNLVSKFLMAGVSLACVPGRSMHHRNPSGDAANAILTAVGYNFRRVLAWLRALLRQILIEIFRAFIIRSALNLAC
jgi:hypothetical protein